jgi:DNA polymerase-3 subunit alpha
VVDYRNGAARVDVILGPEWRVRPDDQLLSQLEEWLAPEHVKVIYAFATPD